MSRTETELRIREAKPNTTAFELLTGDRVVSTTLVHRREMRVGVARLLTGAIGGVHTEKQHRSRGYARQVLDSAVAHLIDESYDISMLIGITDFYGRWGFASGMGFHSLALPAVQAQKQAPNAAVRPFVPGDIPRILEVYAQQNAHRTGSFVRPPFPEYGFRMGSAFFVRPEAFVVERDGTIIGYAAVDRERENQSTGERTPITDGVRVAEVGASEPGAYPAIAAELGRRAEQLDVEAIEVFAPPDHPFAHFCQPLGATVRSEYRADGGIMLRVINLEQMWDKLQPELARRLAGDGGSGTLTISTDLGEVTVPGASGVLEVPQWMLLQLLMGYRDPALLPVSPEARLSGDILPLLARLFPWQHAHLWRTDWF